MRTPARPATLVTVAALAGVSPATASRVVNGSARVAPEHRAAVEQAVARLGYVPNRAARSLVTRRSGAVALMVREPVQFGASDPYISGFIVAASQSLAGTGVQLVVMVGQDEGDQATAGAYVRAGHVDGAILLSLHGDDALPHQLRRAGVPVVIGGRPPMEWDGCFVDVDNLGGGGAAAAHLLTTGRRMVGIVAGPADMTAAIDRRTGARRVLREAGLSDGLVAYGTFTQDSGERATTELLEREPDLDAVFASSDVMALGALRALRAAGRRVPDDVSVVGFDDVEPARYADPPLTTVRQPSHHQARAMVDALLAQVNGAGTPSPVVLPTELVVRESA